MPETCCRVNIVFIHAEIIERDVHTCAFPLESFTEWFQHLFDESFLWNTGAHTNEVPSEYRTLDRILVDFDCSSHWVNICDDPVPFLTIFTALSIFGFQDFHTQTQHDTQGSFRA